MLFISTDMLIKRLIYRSRSGSRPSDFGRFSGGSPGSGVLSRPSHECAACVKIIVRSCLCESSEAFLARYIGKIRHATARSGVAPTYSLHRNLIAHRAHINLQIELAHDQLRNPRPTLTLDHLNDAHRLQFG